MCVDEIRKCAKMQSGADPETQEWTSAYIGGDPEGPIYPGWTPYIPMPTALAYFFCDEGFVIAADGRDMLTSAKGFEIASEETQKIFPVHGIDRSAAFSFTGRTALYDPRDEHKAFDFVLESNRAAREIQLESARNATDFLARVCSLVQERLDSVVKTVGIGRLPSRGGRGNPVEHNIVTIYLDGYFSGYPERVGANFYHVQQKVAWDTNAIHTLGRLKRYWTKVLGSDKIGSLLFDTEDTRLSRYRTEACKRVASCWKDPSIDITIREAVDAAQNYIAACSDDELRVIDPERCRGIGGHIHIASITPKDGFQWLVPPVPPVVP